MRGPRMARNSPLLGLAPTTQTVEPTIGKRPRDCHRARWQAQVIRRQHGKQKFGHHFLRESHSSNRNWGNSQITDLTKCHACLALLLRGLIGEVYFLLQCNEARIGTQWIKLGFYFQENQSVRTIGVSFLEPGHRRFVFVKT